VENAVKIFAPATVSNVGPGFDLMGFALEEPGDVLMVKLNKSKKIRIINNSGVNLPADPNLNVGSVALQSMLDDLKTTQGFDLLFERKINPGSGIGSSAASCTAAVFGANILLGDPYAAKDLIPFALKGEMLASGSLHADNIAPAMLGGFVFVRSYEPLDIIPLIAPRQLKCLIIHPSIEIKTAECRRILPEFISMKTGVKQCGNLAGLITGLIQSDYDLIYRSIHDEFAEPHRKTLIPGYIELKDILNTQLTGRCNISGSGPSIFFLSHIEQDLHKAAAFMKSVYEKINIKYELYESGICTQGTRAI
jgi:homoserine kinase